MDEGAWRATVLGVTKSRTQLTDQSTLPHIEYTQSTHMCSVCIFVCVCVCVCVYLTKE